MKDGSAKKCGLSNILGQDSAAVKGEPEEDGFGDPVD